jgi:hypothetical protein
MTAILVILTTSATAFVAHMVYGAYLASHEYDRSGQAWVNAPGPLLPKRTPPHSTEQTFQRAA